MITYANGNLLETCCQAIVNPVNCVGVMGAGIALQIKMEAPENFRIYRNACRNNLVVPGRCLVVPTREITDNIQYVINLPTKRHWKEDSNLEYIKSGITDLVHVMNTWSIDSVAIPALGTGCGHLDWPLVKRTMIEQLCKYGCEADQERTYQLYEPYLKDRTHQTNEHNTSNHQ